MTGKLGDAWAGGSWSSGCFPNNPVHLLCRAKDRLLERGHLYFLGVNSLVPKEVIRTREPWQAVGV